jgi:hypothetical protein
MSTRDPSEAARPADGATPGDGPGSPAGLSERQRRWLDGSQPWTAHGLAEAFIELARPERGALPAAVHAREVLWLVDRYGREDGPAHAVRLDLVRRFLSDHRGVLTDAGLCRYRAGECCEAGALTLTPGLTHALATMAYTAKAWDGAGSAPGGPGTGADAAPGAGSDRGAWRPGFDLAEVIATALGFDDRADADAPTSMPPGER